MANPAVLVSCEHASNFVPKDYQSLIPATILKTHRAYDLGAKKIAKRLAAELKVPFFSGPICRLVIDLNRSLGSKNLFSSWTKKISRKEKQQIVASYYRPYRNEIEDTIVGHVNNGKTVLHLAIHSFTPSLDGVVRVCDIGLLYDPKRPQEMVFCKKMASFLKKNSKIIVRLNYPYKGASDGLTSYFRQIFDAEHYLGIEIEINQGLAIKDFYEVLTEGLRQVYGSPF